MKNLVAVIAVVDAVLAVVIAVLVAMAAAFVDLARKGRAARVVFVRKVSAVLGPAVKAETGAVVAAAVFVDAMIVAVASAGVLRSAANFLRFRPST
jgi:hypothetical protein